MNFWSIGTFILCTFFLDMLFTYKYLNLYRLRFPKHDWTKSEANPIIRFCVKQLGLNVGVVCSALIILFIIILLISYLGELAKFFLGGVYSMALVFHWINFMALKRLDVKHE